MTVSLYDYYELQDKSSKQLRIWKAWHIILYILAAIFGIMNYTFLQEAKEVVDNRCILYPRLLSFQLEALTNETETKVLETAHIQKTYTNKTERKDNGTSINETVNNNITYITNNSTPEVIESDKGSEEHNSGSSDEDYETTIVIDNITVLIENSTHRLMLNTDRTLFSKDTCEFAEYMPLLSAVFAIIWLAFFIVCPRGGHTRHGLQQPWRILAPALIFAAVVVVLTGHSFATTNGGLQAFCGAFYNYTNSTTCSSAERFLQRPGAWGLSGRVAATRAASAGTWAAWACIAALLLARCIAAPDFAVSRTTAQLKDPQQKVIPYIKKSPSRRSRRSRRGLYDEEVSVQSEPTLSSHLATVSVERGPESPCSIAESPTDSTVSARNQRREEVEMITSPEDYIRTKPSSYV